MRLEDVVIRTVLVTLTLLLAAQQVHAQSPPLLPDSVISALAQELSGEAAKHNLEFLARLHRQRGSRPFHQAAQFIAQKLRDYGLSDVRIEQFPADGKTFYGTQKARPAWDAEFAELWETRKSGGKWIPAVRLASWQAMPITLAEDSESGEVTADLVDVGDGTSENDYAGKDVQGKLVLAAAQPGAVAPLAVGRYGAAGIISYAQNQRTAWWGEDENLVRWGHLGSFSSLKTFAFMVSLKKARDFRRRLARGDTVRLHAVVRAGRHPGFYDVVTAVIPGVDPRLRQEEIAFSCHLDHQRPGANDNASGAVTILEVARTMARLIKEGRIARPRRTLRFIWPPEIEGTLALLNSRPELAARIKAVVHMDMVGGGPATKAIFHVTRGPASLPSFVYDVGQAFGEFVNQQSDAFASGQPARFPLVAPEGGKEALLAQFADFSMGSDHEIYTEGSFRIPAIYLNDWPDRYIHTNFDTPANIDPTKLKRAGFIGAASAYFLANLTSNDASTLWMLLKSHALGRTATMLQRRAELSAEEADNLTRFHLRYERAVIESMQNFLSLPATVRRQARTFFTELERLVGRVGKPKSARGQAAVVYRRNAKVKGPLSVFGYDYLADHYGADRTRELRLLRFQGQRASGGMYAYEVLNFVDGRRNVQEIRDAVSAEFGPVPVEMVSEYLGALESTGVVERQR